jgi:hypothetical protein
VILPINFKKNYRTITFDGHDDDEDGAAFD